MQSYLANTFPFTNKKKMRSPTSNSSANGYSNLMIFIMLIITATEEHQYPSSKPMQDCNMRS